MSCYLYDKLNVVQQLVALWVVHLLVKRSTEPTSLGNNKRTPWPKQNRTWSSYPWLKCFIFSDLFIWIFKSLKIKWCIETDRHSEYIYCRSTYKNTMVCTCARCQAIKSWEVAKAAHTSSGTLNEYISSNYCSWSMYWMLKQDRH